MKFKDLDFPGILHQRFANTDDHYFEPIRERVEKVWAKAPPAMRERFISLSGTNFTSYRGLIFELYVLEQLSQTGYKIDYEFQNLSNSTFIDFLVHAESGRYLVEATSIGPNEEALLKPEFEIDPKGVLAIRKALKSKLEKVQGEFGIPVVLALCNSNPTFVDKSYSYVQALYGHLEIQLEIKTGNSKWNFSDQGFWISEVERAQNYSAIYFASGGYPGFSSYSKNRMWMNPMARNDFSILEWPEDIDFIKSSERLWHTNRSLQFEWRELPSFMF